MHPYVQRCVSFPTPPVPPGYDPLARSTTPGARLMAMLGNPGCGGVGNVPLSSMGGSDFGASGYVHDSGAIQPFHDISAAIAQPAPVRVPSSMLPRGRRLVGDHVVYDVDARLEGEVQPQLEVTPITKYASDPELILGRQIAVNKMYICYGPRHAAIRVLNINTALRALLRDGPTGHTKVLNCLLARPKNVVMIDERVFVWKISEDADEEDKPQILTSMVFALHISGVEGSLHPKVFWHCHKEARWRSDCSVHV
ncbi:Enhancer of mRNA-decapping protein 4-like protein [Drosera capensis]